MTSRSQKDKRAEAKANKANSNARKLSAKRKPAGATVGTPVEETPLISKRDRLPLLLTVALHGLIVTVFVVNWSSATPTVKPLPSHIQATVLSAEQVPYLQKQKQLEQEKKDKALKEKKRKEKLAAEKKRKKKLEEKRKKEAAKKAKLKKEKEKNEKLKKEKERKEKEKKQKAEEKKRLAEELKRKEEKQKKELERKRKEREDKLMQQLQDLEQQQLKDEQAAAEALKRQEALNAAQKARQEYELSETEKFKALIYEQVKSRWVVPPGAPEDLRVSVRLTLLPSGELQEVTLVKSSGMKALDQSVLVAVNRVIKYKVPQDSALFNSTFRNVLLNMKPASKF